MFTLYRRFPHNASSKEECDQNLALILQTCEALRVPLAIKKLEGPTTVIIFLEIELDTFKMEMRLPAEKLQLRKAANKREMLSLIGKLAHAL